MLAMWEWVHKMAPGVLNTIVHVPHLWLYLKYWWNEVDFSSARITFDRLYGSVWGRGQGQGRGQGAVVDGWPARQADRQRDRQMERWTDRWTEWQKMFFFFSSVDGLLRQYNDVRFLDEGSAMHMSWYFNWQVFLKVHAGLYRSVQCLIGVRMWDATICLIMRYE